MKLLFGNGHLLEVRDVGPVLYRVRAGNVPIKFNGYRLLDDDVAREVLRAVLATGLYEGEKCETE